MPFKLPCLAASFIMRLTSSLDVAFFIIFKPENHGPIKFWINFEHLNLNQNEFLIHLLEISKV